MSEQLCDKCKKELAMIFVEGAGKFCLACHNSQALELSGIEDTFEYAMSVSVIDRDRNIHCFNINHIVLGNIVSWEAVEQGGDYHFSYISNVEQNGKYAAQRFFQKIVDGVCTKSLYEHNLPISNALERDGKFYSLRDKGTIRIVEDEDDCSKVYFVIDGKRFSGEELGMLFAANPGLNIQYKIQDESDACIRENDYLEAVEVTAKSIMGELDNALGLCCDRGGFLSYKMVTIFDEMFFPITDKLKILMDSEHRDEAVQTGEDIISILENIDHDDDYFPEYECELVREIIS